MRPLLPPPDFFCDSIEKVLYPQVENQYSLEWRVKELFGEKKKCISDSVDM